MSEIYRHVARGSLYQIVGLGSIKVPLANKYRDNGRCLAYQQDGSWIVTEFDPPISGEDYTVPPADSTLCRMQMEKPLVNGEPVVIYRGEDAVCWVRTALEFNDGRFEKVEDEPASVEPTLQEMTAPAVIEGVTYEWDNQPVGEDDPGVDTDDTGASDDLPADADSND